MSIDGLVERLAAIHQPGPCWSGSGKPIEDRCCGHVWPCPTVNAVYETLGQEPPPAQVTGRWVDGPAFWKGGIETVHAVYPEYVQLIEAEIPSWTPDEVRRYTETVTHA